jgi:hypothetical protein
VVRTTGDIRGRADEGIGVSLEREPADVVEVWSGPLATSEDRLTKNFEFRRKENQKTLLKCGQDHWQNQRTE